VNFVVTATLVQHRFPGAFAWLGKRRYEQAQRLSRAKEKHRSRPLAHLC
jgi:hypothetical protein